MVNKEIIDQLLDIRQRIDSLVDTLSAPQVAPPEEPKAPPAPPAACPPPPDEAEAKALSGRFLSDLLEKKQLADFRKAFSLNDHFRFRRELFGGDQAKMDRALEALNALTTYEDSATYLHATLRWNLEDETVAEFMQCIEKRFS